MKKIFAVLAFIIVICLASACQSEPEAPAMNIQKDEIIEAEQDISKLPNDDAAQEEAKHEVIELDDFDDQLTDEEKQKSMLQQAQQRLTEAVNKMNGIEKAELFLLNDPEYTGGEQHVVVWPLMGEGKELTETMKSAIRELVLASLPDIEEGNMDVTDEYTNLNRALQKNYDELLSSRSELLDMINQRIGSHRDGTFTEMPNHHPDWPEDFPSPAGLKYPLTQEDFVVSMKLYAPSAVNSVWAGGLDIWVRLDEQQHYLVLEPAWFSPDLASTLAGDTEVRLGFGNSGFYSGEPYIDFDELLEEQRASVPYSPDTSPEEEIMREELMEAIAALLTDEQMTGFYIADDEQTAGLAVPDIEAVRPLVDGLLADGKFGQTRVEYREVANSRARLDAATEEYHQLIFSNNDLIANSIHDGTEDGLIHVMIHQMHPALEEFLRTSEYRDCFKVEVTGDSTPLINPVT